MKHIRRGYSEDDRKYFGGEALVILSSCARDIVYLLDRGYPYKTVISFVGNRHRLTERQRNALMRMCASHEMLEARKKNQLASLEEGCTVNIEAFNEKGQCVYRGSGGGGYKAAIEVDSWSRGAYILRISTGAGTTIKKLLLR